MNLLKTGRPSVNKIKAFKELNSEETETLTIMVPASLKANVKIKAIQNQTNVTNLIVNYLKEYVGNEINKENLNKTDLIKYQKSLFEYLILVLQKKFEEDINE